MPRRQRLAEPTRLSVGPPDFCRPRSTTIRGLPSLNLVGSRGPGRCRVNNRRPGGKPPVHKILTVPPAVEQSLDNPSSSQSVLSSFINETHANYVKAGDISKSPHLQARDLSCVSLYLHVATQQYAHRPPDIHTSTLSRATSTARLHRTIPSYLHVFARAARLPNSTPSLCSRWASVRPCGDTS